MVLHRKEKSYQHYLGVQVVAFGALVNGILLVVDSLIDVLVRHHHTTTALYSRQAYIIIGITLVYLAILLWRRKQTAWIITLIVYAFYIGISVDAIVTSLTHNHFSAITVFRNIFFPLIMIAALIFARKAFNVRSDIRSFGLSLKITFIVLLIAFCYGIAGFMLMDNHDFHREIGIFEAAHRTIDQFGLTTNTTLVPYTRRARVFLDSLNVISIFAVGYALLSLFQPLKARLEDQNTNRDFIQKLLESKNSSSEDFFKIWPHDKNYYFNEDRSAGVAYKVHRGVALVVGDPFGAVVYFKQLLIDFTEFCRLNDWSPSFIHTEGHFNPLYRDLGFNIQKIGEEAIVDTKHFMAAVSTNKYFRNIKSKFEKQGYSFENLEPPHHQAVIDRLRQVSDDWVNRPGRGERGFMMGYFTEPYMQLSSVIVLRDKAGTIQAFLNKIPSYDKSVATYDLLRHTSSALSNSTDYLLMNFIEFAKKSGFSKVNLGLCPLVGLDKDEENRSVIDSTLRFVYSNGDRIYSFSGLHRYKQKYEPEWRPRYIAYRNGITGFTKTLTALNVAMKVRKRHTKGRKSQNQ